MKLGIRPLPKQELFLRCPADIVLWGGAAGGGKSYIACLKALILALSYNKIHIGLFRRTLTELRESLQRYCFEIFPKECYEYNVAKRTFTFPSTGSRITLNYLEKDADLLQYEGWEFQVIIIDEAVRMSAYHLGKINARLRKSKATGGLRPKVYYLTNPLGIGASYLKELFITNKEPYKIYSVEDESYGIKTKKTYCYIPSTVFDNKHIMKNDPDYIARLMALSEYERKALIEGIWDSPMYNFFYMWDKNKHIIDSYTPQPQDQLFMSIDWGTAKPFAVYWYAVKPDDTIVCYREYYGIKGQIADEGIGLDADEMARQAIKYMTKEENIKYCVLDNACWGNHGHGKTIFEMINDEFKLRNIPIIKCTKERLNGLALLKYYLSHELIQFTKSCKHFIRTITGIVASDQIDGEIHSNSEDHGIDSCIYLLSSRPKPKRAELIEPEIRSIAWYKQKGILKTDKI